MESKQRCPVCGCAVDHTAAALKQSATRKAQWTTGRYAGGPLKFGYQLLEDGKTIVENPLAMAAIDRMRELRAGGKSFREIASAMKRQGFVLSHEAVRGICRRADK